MTLSMWMASGAWLCLVMGFFYRRQRGKHVTLVLSGILSDIVLVLYLQFTRSALQTALEFKLSLLQQLHIGFSTLALVLYLPVLWLGLKLLRARETKSVRYWHKRIAITALILRSIGFALMFSMIK